MPNQSIERRRGGAPNGRVNNRDRILETALELFNERGTVRVSTNTIAGDLGISPGNLYYHFANKEAIVRELWNRVEEAPVPTFDLPEGGGPLTPEDVANFFLCGIDLMWSFRFFWRDVDELLARDPELAQSFRAEMAVNRRLLESTFERLISAGVMSPPRDHRDLARLCTNIEVLFANWIRFLTTVQGKISLTTKDVAEGGLHAFIMLEPYLKPAYGKSTRSILESHMNAAAGARSARMPRQPNAQIRSKRAVSS